MLFEQHTLDYYSGFVVSYGVVSEVFHRFLT